MAGASTTTTTTTTSTTSTREQQQQQQQQGESKVRSLINDFLHKPADSDAPIQISRLEERSCSIRYKNPSMDVLVAYGACKKNQNIGSPTPVLDGCMEFSSSASGSSAGAGAGAFKDRNCEACGCHRSFHERIILMRDHNGAITCASQIEVGSPFPRKDPPPPHQIHPLLSQPPPPPHSLDLAGYYSGGGKRRKMSEENHQLDDFGGPEFIRSSSAIVHHQNAHHHNAHHHNLHQNHQQQQQLQPMPLQSIEVIEERSSWICEADKDKLVMKKEGEGGGLPVPPEKLASFFERLQKEHPESPLKLEFVDGSWRVLCGVCARYLRADKKGETLHNIQKQHFVTPKHISNLKAKLEAPDEMEFWLKRMAKLREKRAQQRSQPRYITAS